MPYTDNSFTACCQPSHLCCISIGCISDYQSLILMQLGSHNISSRYIYMAFLNNTLSELYSRNTGVYPASTLHTVPALRFQKKINKFVEFTKYIYKKMLYLLYSVVSTMFVCQKIYPVSWKADPHSGSLIDHCFRSFSSYPGLKAVPGGSCISKI